MGVWTMQHEAEEMIREAEEMIRISEEALGRSLTASSAGGYHAALKETVEFLLQRAGSAFAAGRDDEARAIRALGKELEERRVKASNELDRLNRDNGGAR